MVSCLHSVTFQGIDVVPVEVQIHISSGMPAFSVVGLGDKAVAESRERVRAAISSIGLALPSQRITVNLAPADLQKEGSHFDLPIVLGMLASMEVIKQDDLENFIILGELSLDGRILPVSGILPAAISASGRGKGLICPGENGSEATFAGDDLEILAPQSLLGLVNHFNGTQLLKRPQEVAIAENTNYPDIADIKGQQTGKRALEIAAAGGHSMLMSGPPGSGKSMLASRLPGLLPPLSAKEMLEVSMVNSISGQLISGRVTRERPFRAPHHSSSMPALVGGGIKAKPGEITLAHNGVLFLDELPEFNRQALDSLRQPLETKNVTIARAQAHISYPANFQLVAAMNPCRCGYLDDAARACNKAPRCAADYQSKLSGPLLDRFDIHIEVPALLPTEIEKEKTGENSAIIAGRVEKIRKIQAERYKNESFSTNSQADGKLLEKVAAPDAAGKSLLLEAVDKMGLSMRGHNRILRVARTIADLNGDAAVGQLHIAEALNYRHRSANRKVA